MPLTVEKRREYDRARKHRAVEAAREIRQALQGRAEDISGPAREVLRAVMRTAGLTPETVVNKVKETFGATRPWGKTDDPLWAPDHDARMKSVGLAVELLTRAGELPDDRTHQATAGGFSLHVHLDGLRPQDVGIDALPTVDVTPRKS